MIAEAGVLVTVSGNHWVARFGRAHTLDPRCRALVLRRVTGPAVAVLAPRPSLAADARP
jgi:hypothetical protein